MLGMMILYPTETIYALGVNGFNAKEQDRLREFKGRTENKYTSLLVRDKADIIHYSIVCPKAEQIIDTFLPGPLTLVLKAKPEVPRAALAPDNTIRFRISPDMTAQKVIADFMEKHQAPLTCTSANVSNQTPETTPDKILEQFRVAGRDISKITVVDDGPRKGVASTVTRVIDGEITIHREGAVPASQILALD